MIYLSVGTFHKGFDRLVEPFDNFCRINKIKCIAQIGGGDYLPSYIKYEREFTLSKHLANIKKSSLVITHGGYGNILDLINVKKKFIVKKNINIIKLPKSNIPNIIKNFINKNFL